MIKVFFSFYNNNINCLYFVKHQIRLKNSINNIKKTLVGQVFWISCEKSNAQTHYGSSNMSHFLPLKVSIQSESEEQIPCYASLGAAGADVRAYLQEPVWLAPGEFRLIPTGIKLELPAGYEAQVRPRSGLALKHGVTVLNAPGTIDADYRGEVGVILINHGKVPFQVVPGMRIAQLVIAPVIQASFIRREEPLAATIRGVGGFGHTGAL